MVLRAWPCLACIGGYETQCLKLRDSSGGNRELLVNPQVSICLSLVKIGLVPPTEFRSLGAAQAEDRGDTGIRPEPAELLEPGRGGRWQQGVEGLAASVPIWPRALRVLVVNL